MSEQSFTVMHEDPLRRVELALEDLREGRMVILVDDEDRENEGDLVVAAEKVTPEVINFMATHARGLICLSLTGGQVEQLGLPMMASNNQSAYNTAFTVSIEAREGVSTGISAADRAHTTLVAIAEDARPQDIVTPGHVFPLRARDGGVLERVGQTEGSVDLARLAGLSPSGVICEIMKDDGTMARLPDLRVFGEQHRIRIVAVADLIKFRMRDERLVRPEGDGSIDIPGLGTWNTRLYRGIGTDGYHMALYTGEIDSQTTMARVQGAPPGWSFLNNDKCRLAQSAHKALAHARDAGRGVLVLMHLTPTASMLRQMHAMDFGGSAPVERPQAEALRDLGTGCQILKDLGLRDLELLTRSDRGIVGIEAYGLRVVRRTRLQ
jgi:3,4-dihydroxy 2-butanone 4-phosphate synthase/GTP cyclohydrolase II